MESYIEIIVEISANQIEPVSDYLNTLGALAITESDAGDEAIVEPLPFDDIQWKYTRLTALFPAEVSTETIIGSLTRVFPTLRPSVKIIAPQNWVTAWQQDFKPTAFGKRLWICPSWLPIPAEASVPVILDPGLAFGTGTHPTTALCLRWLDTEIKQQTLVIDYGCGSGILGIAAIKLGAHQVIGIDHDPQALESTCANAAKNTLSPMQLRCYLPNCYPTDIVADCVVANIVANPLMELAPKICSLLKPGGRLALSGILTAQIEAVTKAYAPWVPLQCLETQEDWVLLAGTKP